MTRMLRRSALLSLLVATALPAAHAYDGQISFTGQITSSTCILASADKEKSVKLPTVSTNALNTKQSWAGQTPFDIEVHNCPTDKIAIYFEPALNDQHADGSLKNTVTENGANNVALRLRNDKGELMSLNKSFDEQKGSQVVQVNGDSAWKARYSVEYYSADGGATAGGVSANTYFTIVYD